jgi:hypothetical protein
VLPGRSSRVHTPTAADAGSRLACQETATYPPPLAVTARARSAAVTVAP